MACAALLQCAPDGTKVLAFYDSVTGSATAGFLTTADANGDAIPYAGDLAALGECPDADSIASLAPTAPADGTLTFDPGDGSDPIIIDLCDLLQGLEASDAGTELPAAARILGDDCIWYDLPDEVGQAAIVDTGNNTATVTATDTAGVVTTEEVITDLVRFCDGSDLVPATDEIVTKDQLINTNRGHMMPWNAGTGCTPLPPMCQEVATSTLSPEGIQWEWPPGGPWVKMHEREAEYVGSQFSWVNYTVPTTVGDYIVPGSEQCLTPPPSLCRGYILTMYGNFKTIEIGGGVHSGWDVAYISEIKNATGTWFEIGRIIVRNSDPNIPTRWAGSAIWSDPIVAGTQPVERCVRTRVVVKTVGTGTIRFWQLQPQEINYIANWE